MQISPQQCSNLRKIQCLWPFYMQSWSVTKRLTRWTKVSSNSKDAVLCADVLGVVETKNRIQNYTIVDFTNACSVFHYEKLCYFEILSGFCLHGVPISRILNKVQKIRIEHLVFLQRLWKSSIKKGVGIWCLILDQSEFSFIACTSFYGKMDRKLKQQKMFQGSFSFVSIINEGFIVATFIRALWKSVFFGCLILRIVRGIHFPVKI